MPGQLGSSAFSGPPTTQKPEPWYEVMLPRYKFCEKRRRFSLVSPLGEVKTPAQSYVINDVVIGEGSYGKVTYIEPDKQSSDRPLIGYRAVDLPDSGGRYVIKLVFLPPREVVLSESRQRVINALPRQRICHELDRQLAIMEALENKISPELYVSRERARPGELIKAQHEADCLRRYYQASGRALMPEAIQVVERAPLKFVHFDYAKYRAELVYDLGIGLIMPEVKGETLWDFARHHMNEQFKFSRLFLLLLNMVSEFQVLQRAKILHLDANPTNIMVDPDVNWR
jgi:hypothetical protein